MQAKTNTSEIAPITGNGPGTSLACSLNDDEYRERRAMVRKSLLPHILDTRPLEAGLLILFPDTGPIRADVETFARLERECCGFLNFTVKQTDEGLTLAIEGSPEAQSMIETFAKAVHRKDVTEMMFGVGKRKSGGKGLRRTSIAGVLFGLTMLLLCELPIVLAVIGLGGLSAAAATVRPPFMLEMAGVLVGAIGAMVLIGFVVRRVWLSRRRAHT